MALTITTAICDTWKKEVMMGLHAMRAASTPDTFKMALFKNQAGATLTVDSQTTNYSNMTGATAEATDSSGNNRYTAGGFALTATDPALDTGNHVGHITWSPNPNWGTDATITSYGCLLYNSTDTTARGGSSGRAVAVFGFGSDKTCTTGTFTITLPASAFNTSLIRIA